MTTDQVIHQALFDRILGLKWAVYIAAKSPLTAMARGVVVDREAFPTLSCCLGDQEGSDQRSVDG